MTAAQRTAAMLLIGALVLAGCGRDDTSAAPAASEDIPDGPAEGTIEVWAMGTEGELLPELVAGFEEENPDATVNVTPVPWDAAHDRLAAAIAGGETPDVSMVGTTWVGEFAQAGALDATPEGLIDPAAFFPGAQETAVVDGTTYGVPWYVETRVLYYRTDLAEAAGITEPPASWDELKAMAAALEERGGTEHGIFLQPGQTGSWQTVMPLAWQAGAELTDDAGEVTVDSPEMVEALEYYRSFFVEELAVPENLTLRPGAIEQGFVDGQFGMFFSGPWHVGLLEEQGGAGFSEKFAVAPMPTADGGAGPGTSFVGGGNLAVFEEAANRAGGWKLISYLSRPEVQQQWYEISSDLPSTQAAWEADTLSGDENLAVFGGQLEQAKAPPSIPTWEEIAAEIDLEIERVAVGGADPAAAAQSMQQKAASIGTGG